MQKITANDFLNLDTSSLMSFLSTDSDINYYCFNNDNSQCLVLLVPDVHQAYIIFNKGVDLKIVTKKLKGWGYFVLISSNKENCDFIRLKNTAKHSWKVLDLEFKYYAYL